MITASKLELAMECPAAFALPHSDVRVHGSDPERGRERHREKEEAIKAGRIPESLEARWPGYAWQAEVKVFYDLANDVGGIHGYGNDRGYENRGPFVVFGTADAVGVSPSGEVVVVDFKGFNEQTRVHSNPQLSILALALARHFRVTKVDVAIDPEVGAMDVAKLEAMDLDAFAAEASNALSVVVRAQDAHRNGLPLALKEGKHCTFCPAYAACPQKQALALTLKGDPALRLSLDDDKDAADAYEFARRVRELLKRLDAAVYARASQRPIPLADGRMLGQVSKQGNEKLDGDVVWSVVAERHGRDIADTAVIRTATKTRLKEALSFAGVASAAKAEREILETVRARGGASRKELTAVEVYEPQKLLKVVGE